MNTDNTAMKRGLFRIAPTSKRICSRWRVFSFGVTRRSPVPTLPPMSDEKLDEGLYAEIDTTNGTIVLQLEFEKTPLTVANFVGLTEGTKHYSNDGGEPEDQKGKPYYDGLIFHRVIPDFMIQGGCPQGRGRGGPGYEFEDEIDNTLQHDGPGILSMANAGPGTNGSQFFITHRATPHLDGNHTVFGHVVSGQDVVDSIQQGDRIQTVKITRVGDAAEAFVATDDPEE